VVSALSFFGRFSVMTLMFPSTAKVIALLSDMMGRLLCVLVEDLKMIRFRQCKEHLYVNFSVRGQYTPLSSNRGASVLDEAFVQYIPLYALAGMIH
jgi:hypothetical protein